MVFHHHFCTETASDHFAEKLSFGKLAVRQHPTPFQRKRCQGIDRQFEFTIGAHLSKQ